MIKAKGLSLIEIMLVIAIIAVLVLYSLNYLRQRTTDANIDKTARQIEQLLEVASSYYARENFWPENANTLISGDYITTMDLCSPWPGTGNTECPNKQLYTLAFQSGKTKDTANYYTVSLTLPTEEIAQQVSSFVTTSTLAGKMLTAYISVRKFTPSKNDKGWVSSAGIVINKGKISMPICGDGFEGHVIFSPLHYSTDQKEVGVVNINEKYFNIYLYSSLFTTPTGANPNITISSGYDNDIATDENGQSPTQVTYAYFFTFCLPDGNWKRQIEDKKGMPPSLNDGQCTGDWLKYNKGSGVNKC